MLTQYVEEDERLLDLLLQGMKLLEDNYLGGSGSNGAGKVKFKDIKIYVRDKQIYYLGKEDQEILEKPHYKCRWCQ